MATQAKEKRTCMASLTRIASLGQISIADLGKSRIASFDENLRNAIAVKLMVKMKNLFRLKDGLGPCLEDAKVKRRLSFHNKLYSALLHLPPLRFHCADGCWDRTQDRCNWCIGSQTL
jgi:hypothetical protein